MQKLPLEGIRVATLTVVWAGPFAEMLLADWGAEVIRVENIRRFASITRGGVAHPPVPLVKASLIQACYVNDEAGDRTWNRCSMFNYHARSKLGCTMDLEQPEGLELFKQLVTKCDVVIENNASGVVEKLGVGYAVLKEVNPGLIMVSLPGYGNSGPYKSFHGFGNHQEAYAGHTWLRGYPDMDPGSTTAVMHADATAGDNAAYAVMLALVHRRRTGQGQFIDLAQTETALSHQADAVVDYAMNGRVRGTTGNRHSSTAPCGAYRCKGADEWVAISVCDDREWTGFCRTLANPAWTKDGRFSSTLSRWSNQDALDLLVEEWTSQRSNYEVMWALQAEGVAAGPVLSNKDAFDDPQLKDRGQFEELYQEGCGTDLTPRLSGEWTTLPITLGGLLCGWASTTSTSTRN